MPEREDHGGRYQVHASGVVLEMIQQIQRRTDRESRGAQVLASLNHIYQRLEHDPLKLGEPLYRLSALRLQIRTWIVLPLVVDFAVHEDRPLVLVQGAKLLSKRD